MGMLANLMSKVFGHSSAAGTPAAPAAAAATPETTAPSGGAPSAGAPSGPGAPSSAAAAPAVVDVTAILDGLAAKNPEKLDWKRSIVDLMKLVGMDSSLAARKELATELQYPGDKNDSAAMNIWLHKEVIKKIAQNGGKVPQDLLR
ncbi:MAG: DUF3597 domain-containing protein [Chthoniobacterales bacterium]